MIQIGAGPRRPATDIAGALLECHGRIRQFCELAVRLAEAREPAAAEVGPVAARIRRYFAEALPLHVADEEQTVVPRIAGRDPSVDAALEQMRREHRDHEPQLAELIAMCRALELQPGRHRELRDRLGAVATSLAAELGDHLALEEAVIIPAIDRLESEERAVMLDELRARRRNETGAT